MRLQTSLFPDAMHTILADTQFGSQFAATPVRGTALRTSASGRENPRPQLRNEYRSRLPGMVGVQPVDGGSEKPLLPATDRRVVPSLCLMLLWEEPSASIRISRARNTYPAGRERDWAIWLSSRR